jgi:tetratricopeptide (TPR) repeat protein
VLQVLELLPEPDDVRACDALLKLGQAQWLSGSIQAGRESARRAAGLARQHQLPERFADAALGFSGWWRGSGSYSEAASESVAFMEEALTLLPSGDGISRCMVASHLAAYLIEEVGDAERAQTVSSEALQIARRLGDSDALWAALISRLFSLFTPDTIDEWQNVQREIGELLRAKGDPASTAWAMIADIVGPMATGDGPGFTPDFTLALETLEKSRQGFDQFQSFLIRGTESLVRGMFAEADQCFQQTLSIGRSVLPPGEAEEWVGIFLFLLRREQGRLAEFDQLVTRLGVPAAPRNAGLVSWVWQYLAALHAWERGRPDQAREIVDRLAESGLRNVPREQTWVGTMAVLAEVSALLGDRDRAAELYDLLEPYPGHVVLWPSLQASEGPVSYYLGLLATTLERWADAERHFEQSIAISQRIGAPPWVAHARYAWADMLVRRDEPGDRERALALVGEALSAAEQMGMVRLAGLALALKVRLQGILKA